MSCIAGVFHLRGGAVEAKWISRMLSHMQGRAPDGQQVHCDGPIGFGHAHLRTGASGAEGPSPIKVGRSLWVTADARIDGRTDLMKRLRNKGHRLDDDAPHAQVIAQAYLAFGEAFLDHLIGDFAFALWDVEQRRLLCARDHFGVRPFHYAQAGDLVVFASEPDALLALPGVSRALDEASIADVLMFGFLQDASRSMYADVRALSPAHRLDLPAHPAPRPYWSLAAPVETRYPHAADYVARFTEIFEQAVKDRLPGGPVAIQLSGGMDSTSVASIVSDQARRTGQPVTAYNVCSRALESQDDERDFAQLAATHLGLPLDCQQLGRYPAYARCDERALHTSVPLVYTFRADHHDQMRRVLGSGSRVLLTGQGGDAVMAPSATYYTDLLRNARFGKFAKEAASHIAHTRSLRGMALRSLWRRPSAPTWKPAMPDWIEPALAQRVDLAARWEHLWEAGSRADGLHQLRYPWLSRVFQGVEILNLPVVMRHPFYDLRLVQFLLGIPNFMLADKLILRRAMRGRLPPAVLNRVKTGLHGDPARISVTNGNMKISALLSGNAQCPAPVLAPKYLDALKRYLDGSGAESTWSTTLILAPIAFSIWMAQQSEGEIA